MQFKHLTAVAAGLAVAHAVAVPTYQLPAKNGNALSARDAQLGFGVHAAVHVGAELDVSVQASVVQQTCGAACATCPGFAACFEQTCLAQGWDAAVIAALKLHLDVQVDIGVGLDLGLGLSLDAARAAVHQSCPTLGLQCFLDHCRAQNYPATLVAQLAIDLEIDISVNVGL